MPYSYKHVVVLLLHCVLVERINHLEAFSLSNNGIHMPEIVDTRSNMVAAIQPKSKAFDGTVNADQNTILYPRGNNSRPNFKDLDFNDMSAVSEYVKTLESRLTENNNKIFKQVEEIENLLKSDHENIINGFNDSFWTKPKGPELENKFDYNVSAIVSSFQSMNKKLYESDAKKISDTNPGQVDDKRALENYAEINPYNNTGNPEFWDPRAELKVRHQTRRIYRRNSQETYIEEFPFVASIVLAGSFQCAGSIIKDDLVITAASCLQLLHNNRFYRENPQILFIRVGSDYAIGGGDLVPVLEVYFHPAYDPRSLRNNLAIMRLTNVMRLGDKAKRINFDKFSSPLPINSKSVLILGWGAQTELNRQPNQFEERLRYAELPMYSKTECANLYSRKYVNREVFCVGYITRGGGACSHDAGAPGILDGRLVGVVSFGSPACGAADAPTVLTKLGYYVDWIQSVMAQNVPRQHVYFIPTTQTLPEETTTVTTTTTTQRKPIFVRERARNFDTYKVEAEPSREKPRLRGRLSEDNYYNVRDESSKEERFHRGRIPQRDYYKTDVESSEEHHLREKTLETDRQGDIEMRNKKKYYVDPSVDFDWPDVKERSKIDSKEFKNVYYDDAQPIIDYEDTTFRNDDALKSEKDSKEIVETFDDYILPIDEEYDGGMTYDKHKDDNNDDSHKRFNIESGPDSKGEEHLHSSNRHTRMPPMQSEEHLYDNYYDPIDK